MTPEQTKATLPDAAHVQLTVNAGGHCVGETFTRQQAEASGIDAKHFRAFPDEKRTNAKAVTAAKTQAPAGDGGKAKEPKKS